MASWRGAIGLACALAAAGCAGQGQFLGAENQTFTIDFRLVNSLPSHVDRSY